jgi:hypothetical protein
MSLRKFNNYDMGGACWRGTRLRCGVRAWMRVARTAGTCAWRTGSRRTRNFQRVRVGLITETQMMFAKARTPF